MSDCFEDVWLPEVEAEYFALLRRSRAVGVDTGNQFRAFEQLVANGLDGAFRPLDQLATADVYVMYGRAVLMFFAVERRPAEYVDDESAVAIEATEWQADAGMPESFNVLVKEIRTASGQEVEISDTARRDGRRRIAVVKWTVLGNEHEQRLAWTEARERASRVFP